MVFVVVFVVVAWVCCTLEFSSENRAAQRRHSRDLMVRFDRSKFAKATEARQCAFEVLGCFLPLLCTLPVYPVLFSLPTGTTSSSVALAWQCFFFRFTGQSFLIDDARIMCFHVADEGQKEIHNKFLRKAPPLWNSCATFFVNHPC